MSSNHTDDASWSKLRLSCSADTSTVGGDWNLPYEEMWKVIKLSLTYTCFWKSLNKINKDRTFINAMFIGPRTIQWKLICQLKGGFSYQAHWRAPFLEPVWYAGCRGFQSGWSSPKSVKREFKKWWLQWQRLRQRQRQRHKSMILLVGRRKMIRLHVWHAFWCSLLTRSTNRRCELFIFKVLMIAWNPSHESHSFHASERTLRQRGIVANT